MKYRLDKKVNGDWWPVLTFTSVQRLVHMAFICGKRKEIQDVRVVMVKERNEDVKNDKFKSGDKY